MSSAKLAEAFLKGRQQDNTTNSSKSGYKVQWGWGFMPGNGTAVAVDSVTFPQPFAEPPFVYLTLNGYKSGSDPISTSDTGGSAGWPMNARAITASGFSSEYSQASGTLSSSLRIIYTWVAIGLG